MLNALLIILAYFFIFFIVGTAIKNNSIVDIGWGLGFVVASWILYLVYQPTSFAPLLANILISLWGLRLFYYIMRRNIFAEEDFRYQNWRKAWGKWVIPRAFLQVYMLQGLFMFAIGSTVYYLNVNDVSFNYLSIVGLVIWLIGYLFEVIGDRQLKRHIASKRGGIITTGLWQYTRHPNYFGEILMWWGLYLFAVLLDPSAWWLVYSPLAMTYIFVFVSTPLLEERMKTRDGWEEYAKRTNKLFAWFPKDPV